MGHMWLVGGYCWLWCRTCSRGVVSEGRAFMILMDLWQEWSSTPKRTVFLPFLECFRSQLWRKECCCGRLWVCVPWWESRRMHTEDGCSQDTLWQSREGREGQRGHEQARPVVPCAACALWTLKERCLTWDSFIAFEYLARSWEPKA